MIGDTNATVIIGGGTPTGHKVRFVYPDGTLTDIQYVADGGNAVVPTSHPTIPYCTFYGWNQPTTNITHPREIGALYRTTDTNKSYFVVEVNAKTGLSGMVMYLFVSNNSSGQWTIDWGDGEIYTSTANGTITATKTNPYASAGTYTIIVDNTNTGNMGMVNTSSPFGNTFNSFVKAIYFGEKFSGASLNSSYMYSLDTVVIGTNGSWTPNTTTAYNLKALILNSACAGITNLTNAGNLKTISFPDGVSFNIGNLSYNNRLDRFIFPNNQTNTTLSSFTLSMCRNISEIWCPSAVTYLPSNFISSPLITTYNLSGFTTLNSSTGYNITESGLVSINVSGLPTIPRYFAMNAYNLQTVVLPTTLTDTTIYQYAFYTNYSLKTINIPNNVTVLGTSCFQNCTALNELDFPSTLTTIGTSSLSSLYALKKLIVRATTPPTVGSNGLQYLPPSTKIYVPDANVATYQAASGWSTYSTQIYPLSNL